MFHGENVAGPARFHKNTACARSGVKVLRCFVVLVFVQVFGIWVGSMRVPENGLNF